MSSPEVTSGPVRQIGAGLGAVPPSRARADDGRACQLDMGRAGSARCEPTRPGGVRPAGRSTPLRLGQGKAVPGGGLALVSRSSIRAAACVPPPGSGRPVGSKQRMRRPGLRRWPVVPSQAAPPDPAFGDRVGQHHGPDAGRATLLVRAADGILGTHRSSGRAGGAAERSKRPGGQHHGYTGSRITPA